MSLGQVHEKGIDCHEDDYKIKQPRKLIGNVVDTFQDRVGEISLEIERGLISKSIFSFLSFQYYLFGIITKNLS